MRVQHADLRAAYLLLFKYTDLHHKVKGEKDAAAALRQECEQLRSQIRAEQEAADAKYKELHGKYTSEFERNVQRERVLRDKYEALEKEWRQ